MKRATVYGRLVLHFTLHLLLFYLLLRVDKMSYINFTVALILHISHLIHFPKNIRKKMVYFTCIHLSGSVCGYKLLDCSPFWQLSHETGSKKGGCVSGDTSRLTLVQEVLVWQLEEQIISKGNKYFTLTSLWWIIAGATHTQYCL